MHCYTSVQRCSSGWRSSIDASHHRRDDARAGPRRHIFVLDAEPTVLDLVRDVLEYEDYSVTAREFLPSNRTAIEALKPDLVILDLFWQTRDGFDLLERLARTADTAGIPVLVTSSHQDLLAEAIPPRFGAHRSLAKPYDIDVLLETVADLLGQEPAP